MTDTGASLNVCPKWFGESTLQKSNGSVLLRGADGRTLQDYGKRQIWLKIGNNLKRYDVHVVAVTKPILSVGYLCEHGIEIHRRKRTISEVRRQTRTFDQEKRCVLRHGATRTSRRSTKLMSTSRRLTKLMKNHAYERKILKKMRTS